jgi:hypothetical protein
MAAQAQAAAAAAASLLAAAGADAAAAQHAEHAAAGVTPALAWVQAGEAQMRVRRAAQSRAADAHALPLCARVNAPACCQVWVFSCAHACA